MGKRITIDAHTLVWYYHQESNDKLSQRAWTAIKEAENNGNIYVPAIALMEILRLIEKNKYPISFKNLMEAIRLNEAFEIIPLTVEIVELSEKLSNKDIHDRAIISTAIYTDTELVCCDIEISTIYNRVIW
jgi:PIN domain nuclease of toxin-antitoxin system